MRADHIPSTRAHGHAHQHASGMAERIVFVMDLDDELNSVSAKCVFCIRPPLSG